MKSLKLIHATLIAEKDKIQKHIDKREGYVSDRSDKWQESDKGQEYEDKTYELEGVLNILDRTIDELDEWIKEGS